MLIHVFQTIFRFQTNTEKNQFFFKTKKYFIFKQKNILFLNKKIFSTKNIFSNKRGSEIFFRNTLKKKKRKKTKPSKAEFGLVRENKRAVTHVHLDH